jgi:DNA-binding GntR family transcriptional regulator
VKRTSADQIRHGLAARIISGDLAPGTALDETLIAAEFEVSRTPVREALRLLAASGLVDQRPHAKSLVAKPDEAELHGMFEVMSYLESICAGLSATAMTSAEREALDTLHQQMAAIVHSGDAAAYAEANDRFHALIYDGAHNRYLGKVTRATRSRVQPFRRAQFQALGRLAKSHSEHSAIVEAILRGDRAEAEQAMRSHIVIVEDAVQRLGSKG